jgi:hypothetical protein
LSMAYGGWNPAEVGNYLTVTWNREGVVVPPGVSGPATFTINCPTNIPSSIMNFNVNMTITGVMP